jgi:hypothetical protein
VNRFQALAKKIVLGLDSSSRQALAEDPFRAIQQFGLTVEVRDETPEGCSCAGSYDPDGLILFVARTPFSRRSRFTCLHELCHHLIELDPDLLLSVIELEQEGRGESAEEKVCDAFAAEILLPEEVVDQVLAGSRPQAHHLLDLYEISKASREACAVRLSQRLGGEGHVMLARSDGTAIFTASNSDYRVARGTPQGSRHISVRAARRSNARGETFVRFASGNEMALWGDAVFDGQFVYAVLVETPTWEVPGLRILDRALERPSPAEVECDRCGHDFETWDRPCEECGIHRCPSCGRCSCKAEIREKTCSRCHLVKPAHQFPAGSDRCSDCA